MEQNPVLESHDKQMRRWALQGLTIVVFMPCLMGFLIWGIIEKYPNNIGDLPLYSALFTFLITYIDLKIIARMGPKPTIQA